MYRLTLQNIGTLPAGDRVWVRTYKWGDAVGMFVPGAKYEEAWIVEQRSPCDCSSKDGFLESVAALPDAAPPPVVDDVYEEESIVIGNCIWNRLISITGTLFEIQTTARKHGITIPVVIAAYIATHGTVAFTSTLPVAALQQQQQSRRWVGVEEEDTPGNAGPDPGRRLVLPAAQGATTQFQRPRPEGRRQSSRYPETHPRPRGPRMEGYHPSNHGLRPYPPREHRDPRPHGPRSGPGPAFHGQTHSGSAPRQPGLEHGASGPRPSGPRLINPRPPFQERAAVMS